MSNWWDEEGKDLLKDQAKAAWSGLVVAVIWLLFTLGVTAALMFLKHLLS